MRRFVALRCKALAVEARQSNGPLCEDLLGRIEQSLQSSSSSTWTPQGLSMVIKSLAKHRQRHVSVVDQVSKRLVALRVNEQDVGNVANACAQLGVPHAHLISFFDDVLCREPVAFWKPQGFANLLNALSKLQVTLSTNAIDACISLAKTIEWSRPDHVATVANSLSKLQASPEPLWNLPLERFMPTMSPQGQALVLNACARLHVDHPCFDAVDFDAFASEAHEQHIPLLLNAFARFRRRNTELLRVARVRDVRHWSMQGLSNATLALASLDLHAPELIAEAEKRLGYWEEPQHTINVAFARCLHDCSGAPGLLQETLRIMDPASVCAEDEIPLSPMVLQLWQVAQSSGSHVRLGLKELRLLLHFSGPPPKVTRSPFQTEVADALRPTNPYFVEEALVIPYVVDIVLL